MADQLYRNKALVNDLVNALHDAAEGIGDIKVMHVCGTHEHEIGRHALRQLFPENVKLIAGPGCPVCITPASVIATAISIALLDDRPIVCTYGDMIRVPISTGSLLETRGQGADVRIVYSIRDAIQLAIDNPSRTVVFFSVGFETTAAPVAAMMGTKLPDNFLIYACHRFVPPAVEALCEGDEGELSGFVLPGHACVITGIEPYRFLHEKYGRASAVTGFEPVDLLSGLLSVVRQIRSGNPTVANCYPRAVHDHGNPRAMEMIHAVFDLVDAQWRGIGSLPGTGLSLKKKYRKHDALHHYGIEEVQADDVLPGCICHLVLIGKKEPEQCGHFGTTCIPTDPHGPCMVSQEGTCRAHYLFPEIHNG